MRVAVLGVQGSCYCPHDCCHPLARAMKPTGEVLETDWSGSGKFGFSGHKSSDTSRVIGKCLSRFSGQLFNPLYFMSTTTRKLCSATDSASVCVFIQASGRTLWEMELPGIWKRAHSICWTGKEIHYCLFIYKSAFGWWNSKGHSEQGGLLKKTKQTKTAKPSPGAVGFT